MNKRLAFIFMILMLALPIFSVQAQNTQPPPPNGFFVALADVGTRVGEVFSLNCPDPNNGATCQMSNLALDWEWSEEVYPDTSVGCPGMTDVQPTSTRAYRYVFTFEGVIYEYRHLRDGSAPFLCSESGVEPVTVDVTGGEVVECAIFPRLVVGGQGRVLTNNNTPNNLRSAAFATATRIGEIPAGGTFTVLAGPVCTGEYVYWQVNYNGLIGWTAEGTTNDYFLEPVGGTITTTTTTGAFEPLSTTNAIRLTRMGAWNLNFYATDMEYSTALNLIAVPNGEAVMLLDAAAPYSATPQTIAGQAGFTISHVAFGGSTYLAAFEYNRATDTAQVRVWTTSGRNPLSATLLRTLPISGRLAGDLVFAPNGTQLIVSHANGVNNLVEIYDVTNGNLLRSFPVSAFPTDLDVSSATNPVLAAATTDAIIYLWNLSTFTPIGTPIDAAPDDAISGGVHNIAMTPDGTQVAYAGNSTQIQIWDVTTQTGIRLLDLQNDQFVADMTYDSTGTVLIATGTIEMLGEGAVYFIDPATGSYPTVLPFMGRLVVTAPEHIYITSDIPTGMSILDYAVPR